jgi:dTDP-4-dehydrorhamnose 3,5-epimerase
MIDGVEIKKLKVIPDERGFVMEILRSDDSFYKKFGQCYLSVVNPGVIKAWHYHKIQTDNVAVIKGMGKLVLYDQRSDSKTYGEIDEFFIGEYNPCLVVIPPMVLHGIKGIGYEPAYVINCPTELYNYSNPDEYRLSPFDERIPYDWSLKHQ